MADHIQQTSFESAAESSVKNKKTSKWKLYWKEWEPKERVKLTKKELDTIKARRAETKLDLHSSKARVEKAADCTSIENFRI